LPSSSLGSNWSLPLKTTQPAKPQHSGKIKLKAENILTSSRKNNVGIPSKKITRKSSKHDKTVHVDFSSIKVQVDNSDHKANFLVILSFYA